VYSKKSCEVVDRGYFLRSGWDLQNASNNVRLRKLHSGTVQPEVESFAGEEPVE